MSIRTVTTKSSIWKFDLDEKMYVRIPRDDKAFMSSEVPYTYEWEPYDDLVEPEDGEPQNRLLVVRPVPYGTGRLRVTGEIVSDTHANTLGDAA